jgi:electron transfer flavoprotein alpha/beta subunit
LEALGVSAKSVGLKGSPTIVSDLIYIESKRACLIIEGTLEEKADILINKLVEAGVI